MAGPFRSLSSIGSADFGKEAVLAGWAEDVRNLGGIAFLGSVLATASPAIRASKMPPAEALRSFE